MTIKGGLSPLQDSQEKVPQNWEYIQHHKNFCVRAVHALKEKNHKIIQLHLAEDIRDQ